MRLGGFVIHGNARDTLARCLDSLSAVADVHVAVDSRSTDGSAELDRARGFAHVVHPWEGYGAARAEAVRALRGCDYVFFLDSDEWLEPDAIAAIAAWKASAPAAPYYALARRDWAELPSGRFLFRTEHHIRLVRYDAARWDRSMIVHEALPPGPVVRLPAALDHRFATDVAGMRAKVDRYALLWAIRFHREGKRAKPPLVQKVAHLAREAFLKGALRRGGAAGWQLAEAVAHYHARKYALLREVERGGFRELVAAYEAGRLEELYRMLPA